MLEKSSALSDIKILDFSHLLAGPFATQILGDYGAEIFKIERIHVGDDFRRWNFFNKKVGNYSSASYMAWNRNKRSIENRKIKKLFIKWLKAVMWSFKISVQVLWRKEDMAMKILVK